jgi:hypothetical protein
MFLKDPAARLDYGLDWADRLSAGITILNSDWQVEPDEADGLTIMGSSLEGALCVALIEGGVAGCVYRVSNRVELSDGGVDERSIVVRVDDR